MSEKSDGEQGPVGKQPVASAVSLTSEEAERNKKYFAALSCEEVQQLLDALKLSKYKQRFAEEEIDGDLLINGCDDDFLKDQLGMSYKLHRRKLLRLISGEYSAEDVFKQKSSEPARPIRPPKPENWEHDDPISGGSLSHSYAQKQGKVESDDETTLLQLQQCGKDEEGFEMVTLDEIYRPVETVSGFPDTSFSSCGMPKGLRVPPDKTLTVFFHVLVATKAWQWDAFTSHAHIRFGHCDLGNWQVDCGEAKILREVDESLIETVFTLPIDKCILENETPLPYAYAIYSGTVKPSLERLYGVPHHPRKSGKEDFTTRCLVIPRRKHCKSEFHQYDTICYPEQQRFGAKEDMKIEKCLKVYLTDYCITLTGYDTSEAVGIDTTVEKIMHIYKCLSNQLLYYTHSKEYGNMPETDSEKVMQDWLLQISRSLERIPSTKRLISAAVIILCLQQLSKDCIKSLPIHAMSSLLKIVTLTPSKDSRLCPDYEHLCKYISTEKRLLSKAVYILCNTFMKSQRTEAVEWFQALPLYHFLEGFVQPFGDLNFKRFFELELRKHYSDMRKAIDKHSDSNSSEGFFDRCCAAVRHLHLLEADPLLAELFIYICPTRDLPRLFQLVSPHLAVMGVAKLIHDFLPKPPPQNMTVLFKTIIDDVRISIPSINNEERLQLIKACQWVFMEVIGKLESTSQHCVDVVNAAVWLVLHGLAQLEDAHSEKDKKAVFLKLSSTLKEWVSSHLSVSTLKNPKLAKAKEHIKLWDFFLRLDCPKELQNDWEHAVDSIMKECIDKVDDVMKVNLVCVPELDSDHTNVCTTRNLEGAAAHAIKAMDSVVAVKNAQKILSSHLKHTNAVFKILVEERYKENILTLTDLLEWKLWPCLIKYYDSSGCTELMENPHMMSSLARLKVEIVHKSVQNGDIRIQDLKEIRENKEQMKQLLSAASIKKPVIEERLEQLEYIQVYRLQLCNFYWHHCELDNEGILELKEDTSTDLSVMMLKDVIDMESHPPAFSCLKSTLHLRKYFKDFHVLTVEHGTDLFLKFWRERIEEKRKYGRDLVVLIEQVWQSTIQHCESVLLSLHNGTMKTTVIEELFREKDDICIQQEITKLFHGFNKCRQKSDNDSWIEKVVKRIVIHRSLQQYSETAKHFLLLKECLNLTGEFREVKLLSDQVSQAAKKKCLKDINQEVIEAGNALKTIAEFPENLQCLQTFVECHDFRAWLVAAFKDVGDLRSFVLLAVATGTGGEDELTLQKFSNLELVGSVFGPLIYELKKDSGSDALFDAWERVWKGAQKCERMKTILVDLNREVEWFKEVKNGHGSVESTSYGQMDSSIKFGVYHIGTAETHSVVAPRIEICLKEEHGKRRTYSLEQLQELESRLVLMGGSTSTSQDGASGVTEKEKGKKLEIEEFLKVFQVVCQVADLVVELQCEGHVKYIGWHRWFPCSSKCLSDELHQLAGEMKDDLIKWKEEVTKQRQQFYELNNYTTLQLLHLRQELCNASAFSSKVLVLLSSISPQVQQWNVTEAMRCVMSSLKSQHSESSSTQSPTDENYLGLPELGQVLKQLREQLPAPVNKSRTFLSEFLQIGSPNLLIAHPDDVLKTVISIYMSDECLPLPTMEEVLLCTDATTAEEVNLLWRRAVCDPGYKRIFCLVNPENLSYNVADKAFHELIQILQFATEKKTRPDYRLVIVSGSTQTSHAVSKLEKYQRAYCKVAEEECSTYLRNQYTKHSESGCVGISKSRVRVVKSKRGGLGKSFYIQRMTEMFPRSKYIIIPIHGPVVTAGTVMKQLKDHGSESAVFHIDVAPSVVHKVDTVLFGLLILGGLSDSHGRVWRCNDFQTFAVEVTETSKMLVAASFLRMIPMVACISPKQHLVSKFAQYIAPLDTVEFHTPTFQRVYQYLKRYDCGKSLDEFVFSNTAEGTSHHCLQILTKYCGLKDPSWSEIKHFVHFLNKQMKSCENSYFLNLGGPGFRQFVVKFMITMSKDFATSSLRCELDRESEKQPLISNPLKRYEIDTRRKWEESAHPYLLFNEDGHTITFVGVRISVETGDLLHPGSSSVLIRHAVTPQLYEFLKISGVDLDEQWKHCPKETMITKLATVMGIRVDPDAIYDPDSTYVLTADNLIKMLAIQMRFRCNIPVILMGETGCGKTRLIKYMCQVAKQDQNLKNFFMLKVHGGTTDSDILRVIQKAVEEAPKNIAHDVYTVVFFDEANTTEALGLIKEVMCDHRAYGKTIPDSIKLVAACNPYRRHTDEMISNLQSAGLGFHVDATNTKDKFGDIPLRELVYRVLDLPPSMRPLVYDFGQLSPTAEEDYVCHIVDNHVLQTLQSMKLTGSDVLKMIATAISNTLFWCQTFMRERKDECSFVSLRDVERTMMVFDYFYKKMDTLAPEIKKRSTLGYWFWRTRNLTPECQALVLAISVCYSCRLRNRDDFEEQVVKQLQDTKCKRFDVPGGVKQFRDEVIWCQEMFLDNMKIGNNIARNKALRENVFMMVVCIELRIPLFVVGKPGSSKSLAKTVVHDSMTGQASNSKFMRDLKQVHMFSYQCSQLSTSESIIQVFKSAKKYQSKQNMEHFASVVVLDEVGLAEDSPSLPLKALHPLLEDGTAGADDSEEVVPLKERVAFIGISNWALDPAKMNRGIMVVRTDPDTNELVQSARGICSNEENDPVRERLKSYFEPLAEAYQEIVTKQEREFYGLRDFYSLIKMLYWKCKSLNRPLYPSDLQYVIRRNFDGFGRFDDALSCFYRKLGIQNVTDDSCSDVTLMEDSLKSRDISWHGESRYLLLLTENYAALNAILSVLHELDSEIEPYVLFGSGFPKDKEFTQVCCNISRIKHCMQTGRTVVLLNLENLYESLYDLLNQYYTEHGGHRFVDLGLQCHRMKCQVHKDFKVIVIAEQETVYDRFPTPLINRLEKHRLVMESILESQKLEVLREFHIWIDKFTEVTTSQRFRPEDAFVGYHKDIPATVLYQASVLARQQTEQEESSPFNPESDERKNGYKEDVLRRSKCLILQTATPDALIRLRKTGIAEGEQQELTTHYFKYQQHSSLTSFLFHQLIENDPMEPLFMQVTTHSHLPSSSDYENLSEELDGMNILCLFLQEFDTELDFTNKISNIIRTSVFTTTKSVEVSGSKNEAKPSDAPMTDFVNGQTEGSSNYMGDEDIIETPQQSDKIIQAHKPLNKSRVLIVVQCDAAFAHGSLIACGRYRIYDVVNEEIKRAKENADENCGLNFRVHILYVIHVPRRIVSSSFTGFQPKPWLSYHIDSLLPSFGEFPLQLDQMLDQMKNTPLSEFFRMTSHRLNSLIPMASSTIHDSADSRRSTWRLRLLIAIVSKWNNDPNASDKEKFCGALTQHVYSILTQHDEEVYSEREWILNEALSPRQLQRGGTLKSALYGKLDDVVVPILAEIIAFTDRNYNLSLITDSNLFKLWLDIFCNPQICRFKYRELFPERLGKQRQEVPGIGGRRCSVDFECKFPFSWIVKESLDTLLNQALHLAGSKRLDLHAQVCQLIEQTPLGDVLKKYSISESSAAQLLEDGYLHDFIRMSYAPKCNAKNEYRLLTESINQAAQHLYRDTIVSRLAAVHVVFHSVRKEVFWFGQLVEVNPQILEPLISASASEENGNMVLHLMAVSETLKIFDATMPLEQGADTHKKTYLWLQSMYACQRGVHSALHLPIDTPQSKELVSKLSLKWQRQQAVELFIEHFTLQHPNLVSYVQKLNETLRTGSSDFTRVIAIEAVVSVLSFLSDDHKQTRHSTVTYQTSWIQQTSYAFFTDIISFLCFGWTVPQEEVIHKLMSIAFPEGPSSLSYLVAEQDGIPIIRSFLLHLLLKQDFQKCESYLETYFESHGDKDQDILLQCIQGFEDSYHQQMSELPQQQKVLETLKHIKEAHEEFTGSISEQTISSLQQVRAVARLRFGLSVVAQALHSLTENDGDPLDEYSGILQAARKVCTDAHIDEMDTGPAVFLVKQIIKQYGTGCFMTLAKRKEYSWILPERLYPPEEHKGVDPFVIYGQPYSDIRKGVSLAVRGIGIDLLDSSVKQHEQQGLLLQLALYERATLMVGKCQLISDDGLEMFEQYIHGATLISEKCKEMCLKLLRNNLPAASHLRVTRSRSPLEKLLGEVVIHVTLVLMSMKDHQILHPLVAMLHGPGSLKNCYLPTMPEDALTEARKALPGTYYECPRGHPYLITECGRPRTKGNCSECGLPIGGLDYQLSKKNKRLEKGHDDTKSGYLLQEPSSQSIAPLSVRGLTPTSCLIIRMLMHSALLWASASGDEVCIRGIQQIMRTSVKDNKLADFFWDHLLREIQLLHQTTGKSIDDVALLMHLVLQNITTTRGPQVSQTSPRLLQSTEERAQWETELTNTCIQPVLQALDQKLKTALDYLSQDAKEKKDMLFAVVNEMTTDSMSLTHHLWSYRPRITLGHLKQSLQQTNMQKQCQLLNQFLNEEPSLRATKYLPEIVQLQYHLYDKYNYRMDQRVAQARTVAQFLADVNLSSEELSKKYRYLILECLKKAWRLVREELPQHARLRVDGENLMPDVTMETRLDFLIPTTSGHGRCTTALVDYLVQTHNAFIERCQAIAQEKQTRKSDWKKLQVPITHINHCHLIDHEEQLYPIILSHCRYSLKAGHGQEVQYDFPALEKHILKRFIFGKPTILLDIPQVAYQKDVYASVTFQRVREVIKQVPMPSDVKRRVLGDTWTNQQLRKTTDVLEVALGFMSSGAGSANMALSSFVQDTLQIKLDSSIKLPDCSLEHTISLWKVLSVKLCKTLTLADEEPFDVEGEDLLQQLSEEQTTALDAALERFNLNQLLESLLEFTLIFAKYMSADQLQTWPIVGTLEPFLDDQGLPEIPNFDEKFPEDIVVGQTIAVWKHIVEYQKRNSTHDTAH